MFYSCLVDVNQNVFYASGRWRGLSLTRIAISGLRRAFATKNQIVGYIFVGIWGVAGIIGLIYLGSAGSKIKKVGDDLGFIPESNKG